jgi:DNA-binding transcriptional MerR regulator
MTNDLAILRRLAEISGRPFTVGEVADLHGLPGPWTVRRLEQRGVLPQPRRTLVNRERVYDAETVAELRRRIAR